MKQIVVCLLAIFVAQVRLLVLLNYIFNKFNFKKANYNCIWYGECGQSDRVSDHKYNCKYTGPAKPLQDENSLKLLKELCPHLYNGTSTVTCCDSSQIARFHNDLSLPKQLTSRCPACYLNFRTFLCDLTCSPIQSEFLIITKEQNYNNTNNSIDMIPSLKDGFSEITEINYTVTNSFTNSLYNSCKLVSLESALNKP